ALNTWPIWVMNVVPVTMNNTLSAIYDRGLIGTFHDWCDPFPTYPRSYDLLHANNLLLTIKVVMKVVLLEDIMLEMDHILRPQVTYFFQNLMLVRLQNVTQYIIFYCSLSWSS
ncbi:hypothetical protein MTR67_039985, partial [Solanum verrucosum]